jgi:hypothetical protein
MASNLKSDTDLNKLKAQVEEILTNAPDGIVVGCFWNEFMKKHGTLPIPKKFNVTKRSDLLELCSSVFKRDGTGNGARLHVRTPVSAADDCRDNRVNIGDVTAASEPTSNESASKRETGIEGAVAQLGLNQFNMQQGSSNTPSFYDQFYSAQKSTHEKTPQFNRSLAASQQEGEITGRNIGRHSGGNITTTSHQMMPNSSTSSNKGILGNVPSLLDVKTTVQPVCGDSHQSHSAIHRGFYSPASVFAAAQPTGMLNHPFTGTQRWDYTAGSRDSSRTQNPANSGQQSTAGTVFHRNTNQQSSFHSAKKPDDIATQYSTRAPPPAPADGRRMNFSRSQINSAAEDCIERLSAAKDYVSLEKIEKLLLQHFEVDSMQQLYLNRADELACVNEHLRLLCKVNTYIQNFVKVSLVYHYCDNGSAEMLIFVYCQIQLKEIHDFK